MQLTDLIKAYLARTDVPQFETEMQGTWEVVSGVRSDSCFSVNLGRITKGLYSGRYLDVLAHALTTNQLKSDWTADIADHRSGYIQRPRIEIIPEDQKNNVAIEPTSQERAQQASDQNYLDDRLKCERIGTAWLRKDVQMARDDLKPEPITSTVWVQEIRVGNYPAQCLDGRRINVHGMHMILNYSAEDAELGIGMAVGFSFLGAQVEEYLQACGVTAPNELIGKPVHIYETAGVNKRIVGIETIL